MVARVLEPGGEDDIGLGLRDRGDVRAVGAVVGLRRLGA